jgi:hypothetical protein
MAITKIPAKITAAPIRRRLRGFSRGSRQPAKAPSARLTSRMAPA